ncbi:calcium-binding protein [Leptolyngbya cf. ectocarpi LEGE 11479]|uniref:Calcium-binding protein n=1 Tax=Leptolyngbya cf. ectocarpi LEGE 11479 TaxID=1828722 RepID=A0A928ZXD9_LEPEC|nr:calcium-binding protein [Leptolyngbya ectocarpi]MBE9069251.1 calcium-binding protein [Leptolyngbya cf. ectocarpi LEGE 11479]
MPRPKKDSARENRISMDVVVDAYDPEERAMGWYYYIAETLQFPFLATCKSRRQISPLKVDETVEVIDIADADECEREMFVVIRWRDDTLAVPLSQLDPGELDDDDTVQAVEDWLYWVAMGYQF